MKPFICITRRSYEEPHHVDLVVTASNGLQQGDFEIYADGEDLAVFAPDLRGFPRQKKLAELFERFSKLEHRVLEWNVNDGEFREAA